MQNYIVYYTSERTGFVQKRATPKGCPVAMSPFMAGTVKEMEIDTEF